MFYLQEDKRQNKKSSSKPKPASSSDSGDDFKLVRFVYKSKLYTRIILLICFSILYNFL